VTGAPSVPIPIGAVLSTPNYLAILAPFNVGAKSAT